MSLLLDVLRKTGWAFRFVAIVVLPMRGAFAADVHNIIIVDAGETVDIGGVKNI